MKELLCWQVVAEMITYKKIDIKMHPLEEKDSSPLEDTEITRLINVSKELGYKKQDKIPERNLVDFKPTSIMQLQHLLIKKHR